MARVSPTSYSRFQVPLYRPKLLRHSRTLVPCAVTGPPRKDHWKEDSTAHKCGMTFCHRNFSLWERRHHCRRCGEIFCGSHCFHYIRLDQNADFNLEGYASRVCDRCYLEYVRLVEQTRTFDYTFERKELEDEYRRGTWSHAYRPMGSSDQDLNRTLLSKDPERETDGNGRCGQAFSPPTVPRWEFSTF